jgi:hypothetical protein
MLSRTRLLFFASRYVVLSLTPFFLLPAGYWDAKPEQLEKLRQLYTDVEDKIEGVAA